VLDISNFDLKESDLQAKFRGSLDLKNLKYVPGNRLDLQASPNATKGLAREYDLLRNEQGWLEITLELTGDLKKPFPKPILEKPIEKAVGKVKLKIEAKKIEIEEQAKEEAQKQVDEQKEKLKEEAAKQLKNLIKF
ncbi:MAG: hypothetical protein KJ811_04575, partial [Candidatus Margulisbacteria bacterium]|nr:hypothetical protein [Candidatus Margulisiibacteriota bacterium]